MYKQLDRRHSLILVLAMCLGIAACAHQDTGPKVSSQEDLFWPEPPEIKRIQLLNVISGPRNLNIIPGIFTKVIHYLGGIHEFSINSPNGVAIDGGGRLYVVDTALHRVHVFDAKGNTYSAFPKDRTTLTSPVDISVDDNSGYIFVTDSKQKVVKVFTDHGKRLKTEFGNDLFKRPTGIAVNRKTSELLVVDTLKSQVFRFNLTDLKPKGSFGGSGTSAGQFHYPTYIWATSTGNIIVSDSLNFRVQVFSPEGRFLNNIGVMGNTPGTFSRPKGVASDSDGNIYVVDALFDNIQVFDSYGRLLMAFGEHGSGPGEFGLPSGIYIDHKDSIYVSDSSNRRIQVFQYLKEDAAK
jgi:DNA-binding beta-propeller fold protein YncE